jgi:signal transduction histidine kinase
VDLNQLIRETLELVHGELQKRRIVLESELSDGLRPVLADRVQLQQVVLNLITNALEAMDNVADGSRLLRVSSTPRAPDGTLIRVADSGPGLAPKVINRIFEPFFTTKPQGMGMGLSICRSIVEAHHGRLSARHDGDPGAVFEIELPEPDA